MKTVTVILMLGLLPTLCQAQSKVRSRDLTGEWKLVIDIDERELRDEIEDGAEDFNRLGEIIAEAAVDLAVDIIDEIDIRFRFRDDNRVRIEVYVFGIQEVEYADWYINRDGELIIEDDDNDHIAIDDLDVWLREDELLMAFEKDRGKLEYQNIYLIRVDRD